jgi:hypothetical protein
MPRGKQPLKPYANVKEFLKLSSQDYATNIKAHDRLHGPRVIIYQSKGTLDTVAGTIARFPQGGQVTRVSCKLAGAPSGGAFKVDLLIDTVSVFQSGTYLQVADGETISKYKIIERPFFNENSNFRVQVNTIQGATGPMVLTIEYLPEY